MVGWEYVGNYLCISDPDLVVWGSAANFSEASKRENANRNYLSAQNHIQGTYRNVTAKSGDKELRRLKKRNSNFGKDLKLWAIVVTLITKICMIYLLKLMNYRGNK